MGEWANGELREQEDMRPERMASEVRSQSKGEGEGGYLVIDRDWSPGDAVEMDFPMPARWVASHPQVLENTGRAALTRGPLVYCLESSNPHPENVRIAIDGEVERVKVVGIAGLDRMIGLRFDANHISPDPDWDRILYRPAAAHTDEGSPISVTAIPYFAWANGEPRPMRVWLRMRR